MEEVRGGSALLQTMEQRDWVALQFQQVLRNAAHLCVPLRALGTLSTLRGYFSLQPSVEPWANRVSLRDVSLTYSMAGFLPIPFALYSELEEELNRILYCIITS